MKRVFYVLAVLTVGCGSNEWVNRAQVLVDDFRCTQSDFVRMERLIGNLKMDKYDFTDRESYSLAQSLNSKMALECPATALIKCSKGNERVLKGDQIKGPINALGVQGETELADHPEHDGYARTNGWRLKYSTTFDRQDYLTGIACYKSLSK